MRTKNIFQSGKQKSCDVEITAEIFERRLNRHDRRMEYIKKEKPVPSYLEDPIWAGKISDRISAMELPLDERRSDEFRAGAKWGYRFAFARNVFKELEGDEPHGKLVKQNRDKLLKVLGRELAAYNRTISDSLLFLPLKKSGEFVEGFAYGIKCRLHEIEKMEPEKPSQRWFILDTISRHQEGIQNLIEQKKTVPEISDFIAKRLPTHYRKTYGDSFKNKTTGKKTDEWHDFVNRVYKLCVEFGIALPKRGRPKDK